MKTLYVVSRRIHITSEAFYCDRGDILTFSAANRNTLTVYRAQKIVKTMPFTQGGLNALVRTGMIHLYQPASKSDKVTEPSTEAAAGTEEVLGGSTGTSQPHIRPLVAADLPVLHQPVPMTQTEAEAVAVVQASADPRVLSGEMVPAAPTGFEAMTRDQLMDHATGTLGLTLNPQTGEKKILKAIREAEAKRDLVAMSAQPVVVTDKGVPVVERTLADPRDDGFRKVEA